MDPDQRIEVASRILALRLSAFKTFPQRETLARECENALKAADALQQAAAAKPTAAAAGKQRVRKRAARKGGTIF